MIKTFFLTGDNMITRVADLGLSSGEDSIGFIVVNCMGCCLPGK